MRETTNHARQRNAKSSQSRPEATQIWSAEFPINTREFLRAELLLRKTHVVLDLRRWFKPLDGTAQSTKRGFAISVRHLQAIAELIGAALAQASAASLSSEIGGAP